MAISEMDQMISRLQHVPGHEDQIIEMLEGFLEVFPILDVGLFRYSPIGYLTEGVMAIVPENSGLTELSHIRDIRDDIRTVPPVKEAVRERKAVLVKGDEFIKYNFRYRFSQNTRFLLFVPICFRNTVTGVLSSTQFSAGEKEIEALLPAITRYGVEVGRIFERPYLKNGDSGMLNARELEIMYLLSLGESTKSIAEKIHLSEFTVQDYIKASLKKLGVRNRTQAVAELLRKGIL